MNLGDIIELILDMLDLICEIYQNKKKKKDKK